MRHLALWALVAGCGITGGDTAFTISGRVAPPTSSVRAFAPGKTVTHVMAVDPETSAPKRTIAAVASDGSFELSIEPGRPYVLVFVDANAIGADMVVAIFRAGTLDSVSPQLAGHLDLGDVPVDSQTQTATSGVSYDDLLASLGLSASAAELLGTIDDLSLRYANPDIDGNGVLDLDEDHAFALDFHVRSTMHRGSETGARVVIDDITDQFLAADGADVATPVFDLTSIYVLYPAAFDATDYVPMTGMPSTGPEHGGAYTATIADGSTPSAATSFSTVGFGDQRGWGPDYNYESDDALELPGSSGVPATLAYTLGAVDTTLTFTNVVTRTRASLTETGTLAVFLRLVMTGGTYSSIDYTWMKRTSSTSWVPATADEIAVVIGSDGGYVSIHRLPSWSNEFGVAIPAQPSGTVAWPGPATAATDICGLAVSYDDKLGLRHFIGGADPDPGVTCSP
jgi:hypothetical protein